MRIYRSLIEAALDLGADMCGPVSVRVDGSRFTWNYFRCIRRGMWEFKGREVVNA